MKYLCLVYLEEKKLNAQSKGESDALIKESLAHDDVLRKSGHYIVSNHFSPFDSPRPSGPATAWPSSPTVPSPRRKSGSAGSS
jgi:hypothetical protein